MWTELWFKWCAHECCLYCTHPSDWLESSQCTDPLWKPLRLPWAKPDRPVPSHQADLVLSAGEHENWDTGGALHFCRAPKGSGAWRAPCKSSNKRPPCAVFVIGIQANAFHNAPLVAELRPTWGFCYIPVFLGFFEHSGHFFISSRLSSTSAMKNKRSATPSSI